MVNIRPYSGTRRKLLLALDVGTTCSGVSFSVLEPGQLPEIKGVTRFPAQEHVGGDSKVPSIVLYDKSGKFIAAGAEALKFEENLDDTTDHPETEGKSWLKVEWFKLHMRPNPCTTPTISQNIPPLPKTKTIVDVFADFLGYLYRCALSFIRETHVNGADLLASLESIEFVITHPNGWEGAQQAQLREAAITGGLVPDTDDGKARVHFVTEGEAGLHFCIRHQLTTDAMKRGDGVLIVDAGGGTVDLSAYGQKTRSESTEPLYHEITSPNCIFHGSVFVTKSALAYLRDLLKNSTFLADVNHIAECFDRTTKLRFKNSNEPQYIKFGRARDRDQAYNITSGQIKITGEQVACFFEPCMEAIIQAITAQRRHATKTITSVFLIGGFSASDWLFFRLKAYLEPLGLEILRPDSHLNKAVADGAISFYADHFVKARVSRFTYGINSYVPYDITNVEHRRRLATVFVDSDGIENVQNVFSTILKKGTEVMEVTEFREKFFRKAESPADFPNPMTDVILCYRGRNADPQWIDVEGEMYTKLCTVISDISKIRSKLRPKRGKDGKAYFHLAYEIILSFGLTELKAQVCWKDHGREIRTPAKILYSGIEK